MFSRNLVEGGYNRRMTGPASETVFESALRALLEPDPQQKCELVLALWQRCDRLDSLTSVKVPGLDFLDPGRPVRPELVNPGEVPRRRLGSPQGRAALVHAIAHIEFNAINLALDAACRFPHMPAEFTRDWLSVAADEARHFRMLSGRLGQLGFRYGDFPAHDGLWEMARKTAGSCLARMALVPRVLEARGLDVTPGMIRRLASAGDHDTVAVLEVILEEEIRHVEIGTRWYRYCCAIEDVDPATEFRRLVGEHFGGALRGPFNHEARHRAGFSEEEMAMLESL